MSCCEHPKPRIARSGRMFCVACRQYIDKSATDQRGGQPNGKAVSNPTPETSTSEVDLTTSHRVLI